jgi:putative serine protease PepD
MSDDKSHFNRQFIFESQAQPSAPATEVAKKSSRAKSGVILPAAIGALFGALVAGVVIVDGPNLVPPATHQILINNAQSVDWVTGVAATSAPSVVTISVSANSGTSAGTGSGVFLNKNGFIATNNHVVTLDGETSAVQIEVKTSDDRIYSASVVGTDPTNDLAVIKIVGNSFIPIDFADSSALNVGAPVVAIGAPLGYDATVTAGIISSLHRTIQVPSSAVPKGGSSQLWGNNTNSSSEINLDVIQTDAAINPGNSGGALVNDKGQLIGINVAIATSGSSSTGQAGSIGVGFAIPSNDVKRITNQIIKTGKASHGLLGAMIKDQPNSGAAGSFSVGAVVVSVTPGGAADQAGLKANDIVTAVGSQVIENSSQLTAAIRAHAPGDKVTLTVTRGKKILTLTATLRSAN